MRLARALLFSAFACAACGTSMGGPDTGTGDVAPRVDVTSDPPETEPREDAPQVAEDAAPSVDAALDARVVADGSMDARPVPDAAPDARPSPDASVVEAGAPDAGPVLGRGTTYYVSAAGDDGNAGTSPAAPWQTLRRVQTAGDAHTIRAGDNVLFRRGDSFSGTLYWSNQFGHSAPSGTAADPITFAAYGTGAKPVFQYPPLTRTSPPPAERVLFNFEGVDYIVIDGFNVTDLVFPRGDKDTPANCGVAFSFGGYPDVFSDHCAVRNTDISNVGMGVVLVGNFNTIDACSITDLKNLVSTPGAPDTFAAVDDYGANGVTLTGNDNVISHNYFSGNWASSADFTWNGGAIEAFGSLSRNRVVFNTMVDCGGIIELGSLTHDDIATDNLLAFNLMINNGGLSWINASGAFEANVSNVRFYNNTIVDVSNRFGDDVLFGFSSSTGSATMFDLKNNVFYLRSGIDVSRGAYASRTVHQHNVYRLFAGSVTNLALDPTEVSTTAALFSDTTNADPTRWDFTLAPASPARGAGTDLGFTETIRGARVASPPNAGAF